MSRKRCKFCEREMDSASVYCPFCEYYVMKKKNKWLALFLCVFLGFFGAHKFYEEKPGMGFLYMWSCGLCFIGVFIDILRLLLKPNPYYI